MPRRSSSTSPANVMSQDQRFMRMALAEARKGLGRTAPNPVVGSVIVRNGRVIARGFHQKAGTPHAEIHALRRAGVKAKGATLYTTLEPCSHYGRTPPCCLAILEAGVRRVVVASADPNPLVNGQGNARLRKEGVEVVESVLEEEANHLNRPFFKHVRTGIPFVTLKAAVTLDGMLATGSGDSRWITGEKARERVHQLRNQVDAILVGANTVALDDPLLTTRISGGRDALRVVLDSQLRLSTQRKVFQTAGQTKTIIATLADSSPAKRKALARRGVEIWELPGKKGRVNLRELLRRLGDAGVLHLMVEGGAEVFSSFLRETLADELWMFIAPKLVGRAGIPWTGALGVQRMSKAFSAHALQAEQVGEDLLLTAQGIVPG